VWRECVWREKVSMCGQMICRLMLENLLWMCVWRKGVERVCVEKESEYVWNDDLSIDARASNMGWLRLVGSKKL